jgi:hypothetical protein
VEEEVDLDDVINHMFLYLRVIGTCTFLLWEERGRNMQGRRRGGELTVGGG